MQRNDRGLCFVSALTLLSILIVFVLSLTAIQASVDSGLTAEQKSFHSRDCLVIIYGSITATIMCLRYSPNFLTLPRAGTAGWFCFTSSVSLRRALGRELSLAVDMLANAQISTCFVEAFLVLSISIYIIQNFNCQVKNYFWIA